MDRELKLELIRTGVPAIVVPGLRAAISNHYTKKQIDREEEMHMKIVERQNEQMKKLAQVHGGGAAARGRSDPVALDNPGDVYDELEGLRARTNCQFCHQVIDSLMEAPPQEAKTGYEELRTYVREAERIEERGDISSAEAQEIVTELVDRWEVVPKHTVGLA